MPLFKSSITRPADTTQYSANVAWARSKSDPLAGNFGVIRGIARSQQGFILIPQIDVWSSANQTTKLQGILWFFSVQPTVPILDNGTFNIAAADFANLAINQQGMAFTMTSVQASGAANAGITLAGTTFCANPEQQQTDLWWMAQVVNTYTPVSGEVLNITVHTAPTG